MQKRGLTFSDVYDTALYGWTLAACVLSDAEQKTNYVEKPQGDGSWDLSTVLTDGVPRYKTRTLTATLECSEGTREERQELVGHMVNLLDGLEHDIVLPDYPNHYLRGRIHVALDYSDMAHASVTVTAVCEPWLYRRTNTVAARTAGTVKQTFELRNNGRRTVVPKIKVTGDSVLLEYNGATKAMAAGNYTWTALVLTPGVHTVTYSGSGTVTITYREAVLR